MLSGSDIANGATCATCPHPDTANGATYATCRRPDTANGATCASCRCPGNASTLGTADHYADSIGEALVNTTDDTDDATKTATDDTDDTDDTDGATRMFFIPLIAARPLTQELIILADLESRCGWRRLFDRGARLPSLTLCTAYTLRPLLEAAESSDVKKALSTTAQTLVGQSIRIIPSCTAQIGFEQREEEGLAKCFQGMTTTPWRFELLAICPIA